MFFFFAVHTARSYLSSLFTITSSQQQQHKAKIESIHLIEIAGDLSYRLGENEQENIYKQIYCTNDFRRSK